jgi:hypothetical protein
VWGGDARRARTARLLSGVDEVELTAIRARRVGVLLRAAGANDVVDASLIDASNDGDEILTSDPGDLQALADASGKTPIITKVS